jgi:heme exporter protein B
MLYYYTVTSPTAYILSKILYNLVLMAFLNFLTLILYIAFMGDPSFRLDIFIAISFLGSMGLSLVFTMLAAIASKAMQQASLMAILGFPVIIPQLLLLVRLSRLAFAETFQAGVPLQVVGLLLALDVSVVVLALILFPFLWKD